MLLGRNAFSHMCFSTGIFLTQRILYTQKLPHTELLLRREDFAQKYVYTEVLFKHR